MTSDPGPQWIAWSQVGAGTLVVGDRVVSGEIPYFEIRGTTTDTFGIPPYGSAGTAEAYFAVFGDGNGWLGVSGTYRAVGTEIHFDLVGEATVCDYELFGFGPPLPCETAPVSLDAVLSFALFIELQYVQTDLSGGDLGLVREVAPDFGQKRSDECQVRGGDRIVDTTTAGVHAKVYTHQPSATDVDVCVRVEDQNGEGYGGKLALTPSGADPEIGEPGLPERDEDQDSGACTRTTPNMVPGPHPLSFGGVGPVDYMVDAYASGSEAWLCLEVNSTVTERVIIPLSDPTPDVSVGYVATWYPDPDMP